MRPLLSQASYFRAQEDAAMNDSTKKSVILIVDDDAESREVLSELLTREGYTVGMRRERP